MPLETIVRHETQRLEILNPQGFADPALDPHIASKTLLEIYQKIIELRAFDERAIKLQRQGRLGTYPSVLGQEVSQLVPAFCLKASDWMIPTYRGTGAYYGRGMKFRHSLLVWAGDDRGTVFPEENRDMTFSITVGGHLTLAAGLAWAAKLEKKDAVVLAYLGDGASSKGDLHEALTFAGTMSLPVIFLVENNQWAISVSRQKQCAAETFAQKAHGYGVFGLQADGNDALAVFSAMQQAMTRGREGRGGTLLELETYRMANHTTADDASRYRSKTDLDDWAKRDPLLRLRRYLETLKLLDGARNEELVKNAEALVDEEIKAYEAFPEPNPLDMFANNYANAPKALIEQRSELEALLERKMRLGEIVEIPPLEGRFP
jgi:pyruvate dehydrogenase E1 component alpha subunit